MSNEVINSSYTESFVACFDSVIIMCEQRCSGKQSPDIWLVFSAYSPLRNFCQKPHSYPVVLGHKRWSVSDTADTARASCRLPDSTYLWTRRGEGWEADSDRNARDNAPWQAPVGGLVVISLDRTRDANLCQRHVNLMLLPWVLLSIRWGIIICIHNLLFACRDVM